MKSYRKTAIIVGVLFIIATVASILTIAILGSTLETPLNHITIIENEYQIDLTVLLWLILAVSVTGIGVMMYPILKKYNEGLALGYIGFRLTESICIIISTITLLSILTLSQDYASGTFDTTNYQSMGLLLLALQNWSFEIGTLVFLGLGGLFLYYPLYELKLVPRILSIWGIIGAACVILYGVLSVFGLTADSITLNLLAAPIAIQEMVFAVWLIVKGFFSIS
ncbi:hypothetical protein AYK25_06520 [Thermoplasmatales archaeon SM1-50]|nr:MAG: hypothetical protein AYK25_06520 [Thermoplasmatales archaeon SM1-50]